MDLRDSLGREFRVGDFIVYPIRRGSWLGIRKGKIIEIEEKTLKILGEYQKWGEIEDKKYGYVSYIKKVTILRPERATIVNNRGYD